MKPWKARMFSPACFGIVIVCFLFPFMDVKYNQSDLIRSRGIHLVTGSSISLKDFEDQKNANGEHAKPGNHFRTNYFALAALVLAIGGSVLSMLMSLQKEAFMSMVGFAGGLSLLLMRVQIDSSIEKTVLQTNYNLHAEYCYGYWIAVVTLLLAGAVNLFEFIEQQQAALLKAEHFEANA